MGVAGNTGKKGLARETTSPLRCRAVAGSRDHVQRRRKILEFRGAEARRHAALPCFSPANIELFIAANSPDDSLLLSWVHSDSLPPDKLSTYVLLSILHLFASLTCKERCSHCDHITALTQLCLFEAYFHITWKSMQVRSVEKCKLKRFCGVHP